MKVFKNEMENREIKFLSGKFGTFTVEETIGEDGVTALKALLKGYKIAPENLVDCKVKPIR